MNALETIKRIQKQFNENINSHVFLIETNDVDKALDDIKKVIKIKLNSDEITNNQIDNETYLETIFVKTNEKEIKKDEIINLQERIKTKPILSDYLFYIIIDADKLNESASNKLLKTIEEPEQGIIGFLITKNISQILPTIKSRCQIETVIYENAISNEVDNEENLNLSKKIIEYIEKKDFKEYIIFKQQDESIYNQIKENGINIANIIKDHYNNACNLKKTENVDEEIIKLIIKNNNYKEILEKAKYINNRITKTTQNMNANLFIDEMVLEMKDVKHNESSSN